MIYYNLFVNVDKLQQYPAKYKQIRLVYMLYASAILTA